MGTGHAPNLARGQEKATGDEVEVVQGHDASNQGDILIAQQVVDNVSDDFERERLNDIIDEGHVNHRDQAVHQHHQIEHDVPEPAAFETAQTEKVSTKKDWDETDEDFPVTYESIINRNNKGKEFIDNLHEKYPLTCKSKVQTQFKEAGEKLFAAELAQETARHAGLSASFMSTTLSRNVTSRRQRKAKSDVSGASENENGSVTQ